MFLATKGPLKYLMEFKIFNDGFFAVMMQDMPGRWDHGGAGMYELNGTTLRQRMKYDTDSSYNNWEFWQTVYISNDTLYTKLFNKVLNAKGEDVSNRWPTTIEEKYVRAKK